jgi:hypothetical protein
MKKLFLTFAVLSFVTTVSFAQTNQDPEAAETYESNQLEIERLSNTAETTSKKKIEISELPLQVQEALQNSAYQEWEVAEIYEIQQPSDVRLDDDDPRVDEPQYEYNYEILLISEEVKEELEDSQETIAEEQQEIQEEEEEEDVAVSTETLQVEVPSLTLHYDQTGELLDKQENLTEVDESKDY